MSNRLDVSHLDLPSGNDDSLYFLESERVSTPDQKPVIVRTWIERDFRGFYSIAEIEMILADMKKVEANIIQGKKP